MQKLTEKSKTLVKHHISSSEHAHTPYTQPLPQLPLALANRHGLAPV